MSHFTIVKSELRDALSVVAALTEMGWKVEYHVDPVLLAGYYGETRPAVIVLRRAANPERLRYADAGYAVAANGTLALIYDNMEPHIGQAFREDVTQYAGLCLAERIALEEGQITERERLPNGDVDLVVTGFA